MMFDGEVWNGTGVGGFECSCARDSLSSNTEKQSNIKYGSLSHIVYDFGPGDEQTPGPSRK